MHNKRTQSLYETLGQSLNRVTSMDTLAICPSELQLASNHISVDFQQITPTSPWAYGMVRSFLGLA